MSESEKPQVGTICWRDLTVDDAEAVRDFYEKHNSNVHRGVHRPLNSPSNGRRVATRDDITNSFPKDRSR